MQGLFLFDTARRSDPAVETWLADRDDPLDDIASRWFGVLRDCGDKVRELLHGGHPTANAHVNFGFYKEAELPDPVYLVEGGGKMMRHVKLRPEAAIDAATLTALNLEACGDMRTRLWEEAP